MLAACLPLLLCRWVQEVAKQYGRIDILVNCAAGNFLATAEELSTNGFRTGVGPCDVQWV